jgi:hypothetical protein
MGRGREFFGYWSEGSGGVGEGRFERGEAPLKSDGEETPSLPEDLRVSCWRAGMIRFWRAAGG